MSCYGERVLPRLTNRLMNTAENRRIRQRVCAGLQGDVVEIGFGSGLNLPHLPPAVTAVRAVEPAGLAVELARARIAAADAEVQVIGLDGQQIPLPDDSADSALCTWSLCTIPDPVAAVREVRRVLKPGGRLHFVEHGRSPDDGVRRWQDRLNPMQRRIGGGCHLNRDIPALLAAGGLTIAELDTFYVKGEPKPYGYMYLGTASR